MSDRLEWEPGSDVPRAVESASPGRHRGLSNSLRAECGASAESPRTPAASGSLLKEMTDRALGFNVPGPHNADPCCSMGDYPYPVAGTCYLTAVQMRALLEYATAPLTERIESWCQQIEHAADRIEALQSENERLRDKPCYTHQKALEEVAADRTRLQARVSELEGIRETMIQLWGDWATNGWSRPDDDLQSELGMTGEEQRRGLAYGKTLRENLDDAMTGSADG